MRKWIWILVPLIVLQLPQPSFAEAVNIAGRWESNFGLIILQQDGDLIAGTYSCCGGGKLQGRLDGNLLKLDWSDPVNGEGWAHFEIAKAKRELHGSWAKSGEALSRGPWNAVRLSEPELRGEPSYWHVEGRSSDAGVLSGTAVLYRDGERIVGKIEGVYHLLIAEQSMRIEVFNRLEGTAKGATFDLIWHNPVDGSSGTMTLRQVQGLLIGTWRTHDGQSTGEITFSKSVTLRAGSDREIRLEDTLERLEGFQEGSQHLERANSLRDQGRYQDSVREYQLAIALIPGELHPNRLAAAYYGMGDSYRLLGREDEAERSFQAVLDFGDDIDEALRVLAEVALH